MRSLRGSPQIARWRNDRERRDLHSRKDHGAEGHPHANVVIGDVVHWPTISKGSPEASLYFYEGFLSVYDNALRRRTGSYYTPPEIVTAMVRLVDEILRDDRRFGVAEGIITPETSPVTPR